VIVVLNGTPRSGKSSIVTELQAVLEGVWMNLGVDVSRRMTPPSAQPGIGLRPSEPTHTAAPLVPTLYAALWESIAAHERLGLNVAVDVGLYDVAVAIDGARRLAGLPVLFVGVRCPVDVAIARRREEGDEERYATDRVLIDRWEREVHGNWAYDLEVDTSVSSAHACALAIEERLAVDPPPSAVARLATFLA
jgi:chloramphenicol 3-O phosphotransferase